MSVGQTTGASGIGAALQQQLERLRQAAGQGVYAAANNIMVNAKDRVPVDLGTLKGSGYVTAPRVEGDTVSVEAGFGGPAESYAGIVHERTEVGHPHGEAKFLERAVDAGRQEAKDVIASFVADAVKGEAPTADAVHPTTPNEGPQTPDAGAKRGRKRKAGRGKRAKKRGA